MLPSLLPLLSAARSILHRKHHSRSRVRRSLFACPRKAGRAAADDVPPAQKRRAGVEQGTEALPACAPLLPARYTGAARGQPRVSFHGRAGRCSPGTGQDRGYWHVRRTTPVRARSSFLFHPGLAMHR